MSLGARIPPRLLANTLAWLAVLSHLAGVTGCAGYCVDVPLVQARMPATVERSGETNTVLLQGDAVDDQYNVPNLHRFLLSDISTSNEGATWSMSAAAGQEDVLSWLAIQLQGSFQPGDVVQVTGVPGTSLQGLWNQAPQGARGIQVSAPGFTTASASGTFQVLGVGPLRLRLDVVVADETGEQIRIQGDMTASAGQDQSCSD